MHACGPRRFAGKAELTGRSHDTTRESGRVGKWLIALTRRSCEAEIERGARGRGRLALTHRPHRAEGGRAHGGKKPRSHMEPTCQVARVRARGPAGLDWPGLG